MRVEYPTRTPKNTAVDDEHEAAKALKSVFLDVVGPVNRMSIGGLCFFATPLFS